MRPTHWAVARNAHAGPNLEGRSHQLGALAFRCAWIQVPAVRAAWRLEASPRDYWVGQPLEMQRNLPPMWCLQARWRSQVLGFRGLTMLAPHSAQLAPVLFGAGRPRQPVLQRPFARYIFSLPPNSGMPDACGESGSWHGFQRSMPAGTLRHAVVWRRID